MIRLLNTRPSHQSTNLTKLIQQSGGTVFHLPLIEIEAIAFEPVNLDDFDMVIFTSANALWSGIRNQGSEINKIIAIGSATKNALLCHGFSHVIVPAHFSSEGILDMPQLQHIQKKSIAIISGENPKPLLKNELTNRGAFVKQIFTYRRKTIYHNIEKLFPDILNANINTVVVTSNENFLHLMNLFHEKKYRDWLLSKTICVVNEKTKNAALSMGFSDVIQAEEATDDAIMDVL